MRRIVPALVVILLVLLTVGSTIWMKDPLYYPWMVTETEVKSAQSRLDPKSPVRGRVKISFLGMGLDTAESCDSQVVAMTEALQKGCPTCAINERHCLHPPTAEQRSYLSNEPADHPVATYPAGVVIYESPEQGVAEAVCEESALASGATSLLRCVPSKSPKPAAWPARDIGTLPFLTLIVLVIGMLSTWLGCYLLIRYESLHARYSIDAVNSGPQKTHVNPTSRIGGVTILFSLMLIGLVLQTIAYRYGTQEYSLLILAAIPAFAIGLAEDVTKKVSASLRLAIIAVSALVGILILDAQIVRIDNQLVDAALAIATVSILFTVFAIAGVTNAFNIIDGINGLAGGTVAIAASAIGVVGWQVGDGLVAVAAFGLAGAAFGFLTWNWPHGRIFLGDGGAYLAGFWLALLSVVLVYRNTAVSPWFPLAVLIYPIFETIYSILRRRNSGRSPDNPDAEHLHQKIYRILLSSAPESALSNDEISRLNGKVSLYFWLPSTVIASVAVFHYQSTSVNAMLALLFCIGYSFIYMVVSRIRLVPDKPDSDAV